MQEGDFDFHAQVGSIDGWLTVREGTFLHEAAKTVPKDSGIVEIGSWKGRSTICLASGTEKGFGALVYAIDPHVGSNEHQRLYGETDTFSDFLQNVKEAGVQNWVVPIRKRSADSLDYVPHSVGFLFVDGAHSYRAIKRDLDLWFPKVAVGGRIAVHDSWQILGPHLATAMLLITSPNVRRTRVVDTITVFEKTEHASLGDRLQNLGILAWRMAAGFVGWMRLRNSRARLAKSGLARP